MSSRLLLYYAGMADDLKTEQIGLAVSDGGPFERVGKDGLIVTTKPSQPWRSLRVCNPTVIRGGDSEYVMYFQGIADGPQHTSLAIARSEDGVAWEVDAEPFLHWEAMREVDPLLDSSQRVGLWEPAVIVEPGRVRLWFVYAHPSQPGNSIWYAERVGTQPWRLGTEPVLSGQTFGNFNIHYPQVIRDGRGYAMWFTLRNRENDVDGIFVATSADGTNWRELRQVLPPTSRAGISLEAKQALPGPVVAALERTAAGRRISRKLAVEAFRRTGSLGANAFGYSHPHVARRGDDALLVFHNDHMGSRGRWMDIAAGTLVGDEVRDIRTILSPGATGTWDGYFVADPFLVVAS